MSRQSGDGRAPDRSSFAEQRRPAGIIPDTETTRAPYPGREAEGGDDDYSELLRAAWEQLEPQVRSQKALLASPSMKHGVQVMPHHACPCAGVASFRLLHKSSCNSRSMVMWHQVPACPFLITLGGCHDECSRYGWVSVTPVSEDLVVPQAGAQADIDVLVLDIDKVDKDPGHRSLVLDRAMRTRDMDNERFLRKVRERLDRCVAQCMEIY